MDYVLEKVVSELNSREGWTTSRQLVSEAAERPDIHRFGVLDALCDLRADPVGRITLRLCVVFLLGVHDL